MIELAMDGFFRMDYELMQPVGRAGAEHRAPAGRPATDRGGGRRAGVRMRHTRGHGRVRGTSLRGGHARGRARRSRARPSPGCRRQPGRRRALPRPLRGGGSPRRTSDSGRPGYGPGRVHPASVLDTRPGQAAARPARAKPPSCSTTPSREHACSGNVQALAGNLGNRSFAALAAGDRRACDRHRPGVRRAGARLGPEPRLRRRLWHSLPRCSSAAIPSAPSSRSSRSSGGEELPLIPGVWRAKWLELLTRCRLALRQPGAAERAAAACRRPRPRRCSSGRRLRWRIVPPPRSTSRPAGPTGGRVRPRRGGRRGRGGRAGRGGARADARGPRTRARRAERARGDPSSSRPRRSSRRAGRFDIGRPRSASFEASASASTTAPVRARPTGPAWRR